MRAEKGSVREEVIHYLTGYPAGACPSYYRASTVNLESTLNIRSMILDRERKPENPERTNSTQEDPRCLLCSNQGPFY